MWTKNIAQYKNSIDNEKKELFGVTFDIGPSMGFAKTYCVSAKSRKGIDILRNELIEIAPKANWFDSFTIHEILPISFIMIKYI